MTDHEIFRKFLEDRGFGNIRVSGKILDAAALFRERTFAFSFSHSNERVDEKKMFTIENESRTVTHGRFAFEVGYDFFFAVVFHPRDFILLYALTPEDIENKNFHRNPTACWRVRYLLDFVFFNKIWREKEKGTVTKRGRIKTRLIVCNGMRFDNPNNEYIECLFRNNCIRYKLWCQYEQYKEQGILQKRLPDVYIRNVKPVFSMAKEFRCKYYKKPKRNAN